MFTINQIDSLLYGDRDLTINEVDHLLDAQAEMNLNGSDQSDALELPVTNANYTGQADFLPPPNDGPLELPRTMDQIIQADLEKRKQRDLPKPEARPKTFVTNEPDDDSVTDSEDLLPLPRMIY